MTVQITINKRDLQTLLACIMPAVSNKPTFPVLACALLTADGGELEARSSNTYTTIRSTAAAALKSPGQIAVQAKTLFDSVGRLPDGEASLRLDGNKLLVRGGKAKYALPTMAAQDFPPMPSLVDTSTSVKLQAVQLMALLKAVDYAAGNDDTRPHLAGVCFETSQGMLRGVCTDGHRLATSTVELISGSFPDQVLMPNTGLSAISKLCDKNTGDVELTVSGGYLFAESGNTQVALAIAQEVFPNWTKVVPQSHQHRVNFDRAVLIAAVQGCAVILGKSGGGVKLHLTAGKLALESADPDRGDATDELDVDYAGEGLSIGCNPAYFLQALQSFESDEATMELGDARTPIKIASTTETTTSVVMPMLV